MIPVGFWMCFTIILNEVISQNASLTWYWGNILAPHQGIQAVIGSTYIHTIISSIHKYSVESLSLPRLNNSHNITSLTLFYKVLTVPVGGWCYFLFQHCKQSQRCRVDQQIQASQPECGMCYWEVRVFQKHSREHAKLIGILGETTSFCSIQNKKIKKRKKDNNWDYVILTSGLTITGIFIPGLIHWQLVAILELEKHRNYNYCFICFYRGRTKHYSAPQKELWFLSYL